MTQTAFVVINGSVSGKRYHTHKDCRYIKGKTLRETDKEFCEAWGRPLCKECESRES